MKGLGKKLLLTVVLVFAMVGLTMIVKPATNVKAATKTAVQVKRYKKVKKYRLRKKVRGTRTSTRRSKRTNIATTKSSVKYIKRVVATQVVTQTRLKKKLKTVTTKTTVKTTIYTTSYVINKPATITQLNGILESNIISAWNRSGYKLEVNPNSSLLRGADGVFSPYNKKIVLKTNVNTIFLHEMGHFVDMKNGYASDDNEFVGIFQAEKYKFNGSNRNYARTNSEEYFAEAFKEYHLNQNNLKNTCPRTYTFVREAIASIE